MDMNDFVDFQTEMIKKQAVRKQEHLDPIFCRYELKERTSCVVQQSQQTCLDCAVEHTEAKEKGARKA